MQENPNSTNISDDIKMIKNQIESNAVAMYEHFAIMEKNNENKFRIVLDNSKTINHLIKVMKEDILSALEAISDNVDEAKETIVDLVDEQTQEFEDVKDTIEKVTERFEDIDPDAWTNNEDDYSNVNMHLEDILNLVTNIKRRIG